MIIKKRKKYYLDINFNDFIELSNINYSSIKELHLIKFKKYITDLYLRADSNNIATLSQRLIYECFTSNYYKKINKDISLVDYKLLNTLAPRIYLGSNLTNLSSKYHLKIDLDKYLDENNEIPLIPYEVKDIYEKKDYLVNYITIDKKNLIKTIEELKKKSVTKEDKKDIIHYQILLNGLNKDTDKLTLNYSIKPAGRLYNQYSHIKKDIRNNLLKGYIEYDISTASFQWLYDISTQIDKDIKLPLTKHFLENKKEMRYKFAEELGTSYEVIKSIITSIGFGAKTEESYLEYYDTELLEIIKVPKNAIEKILSENNISQKTFNDCNLFQSFIKEIKKMKKIVSSFIKENYYNPKTKVITIDGKKLLMKGSKNKVKVTGKWDKDIKNYTKESYEYIETKPSYKPSKALSFMYQHYESNFLLSMVKTYKENTKNKDFFMLHDALIVKKDIDIRLLEESKQTLYFKINWKLEREII